MNKDKKMSFKEVVKKSKIKHLEPSVKNSMKEDFEKALKEINS